jgi:rare lipoprotein A
VRRAFATILVSFALACPVSAAQDSKSPRQGRDPAPSERSVEPQRFAQAAAGARRGKASYYHRSLSGEKTASGQRYDPSRLTAAHRTLPLGSRAQVTNVENGKSVTVLINDRGPYRRGRIIDLSRAAAQRLEIIAQGIAEVRVRPLE